MSEINREKLMSDIKTVLADAEDLLKQAASTTGERATELREKAVSRLKQAKEKKLVGSNRDAYVKECLGAN